MTLFSKDRLCWLKSGGDKGNYIALKTFHRFKFFCKRSSGHLHNNVAHPHIGIFGNVADYIFHRSLQGQPAFGGSRIAKEQVSPKRQLRRHIPSDSRAELSHIGRLFR